MDVIRILNTKIMKTVARIAMQEAIERNDRATLIINETNPGWHYTYRKHFVTLDVWYVAFLYCDEVDERMTFTNFNFVRSHFLNDDLPIVIMLLHFFRNNGCSVELRPKKELEGEH